ncbi:MAG: prolipoprotein diacylglyceryl transferase, partial [Clostridia bacterium]|nr:prolipoprotein diacylglyceryl transferase [Clostridia bacterium]
MSMNPPGPVRRLPMRETLLLPSLSTSPIPRQVTSTLIVGILCARIYYVIFEWDFYSHNIAEIFKIWHGGLAIHGGLIGGIIVILGFSRKYNVDCRKLFDM